MAATIQDEHVTDKTFNAMVINSDLPVLVDFWAPWCGPCRTVSPIVDEIAQEYAGKVRVVKINVDEGQRTAMALGVTTIPTIILFAHGRLINRQVGANPNLF